MSSLITIRNADSVHWYDKDGKPRHEATLREARKEHLYPSVTSILSIKDKPQLAMWKTRQLVEQALTVARLPDESDDIWWSRVLAADAEERAVAPDLGSEVHLQLSDYISGREAQPRVAGVDLGPVLEWIDSHNVHGETEKRFCYPHLGYSGCIDFEGTVDGRPAKVDWKTQGLKNGKPTFYPEWCWQLVAYDAVPIGYDLYSVVIDTATSGVYPKLWKSEDTQWAWKGFLGLLEAWIADRKYDPRE